MKAKVSGCGSYFFQSVMREFAIFSVISRSEIRIKAIHLIYIMDKQRILLVSDMVGYGKVATAAMLPILSYMGHPVYNLPTSLISNTFPYGRHALLETTDYIREVFPVWKELGFRFDAIATGYVVSERQARTIADYCREQAGQGTLVFVDPVMADCGKLYHGVTETAVECMREMVSAADLTYPNYTEACYLTDTPYHDSGVSPDEARRLLDKVHGLGARSVLITSIRVGGVPSVVGFNHFDGSYFALPYDEIPVQFPGTGDIFSAVLVGHLLDGMSLRESTRTAMDVVYRLIDLNKDNADKNEGIPLEKYLDIL